MAERVAIKKGGRIVIPKPVRDALGFEDGDVLMLDTVDGRLVLEHEETEQGLVRRGKRLFKPSVRGARKVTQEEVNELTEIMRDPVKRTALEAEEAS